MILNRLYELAERHRLLADPAFEDLPVPFVIQLGPDGNYLPPLSDRRSVIEIPSRRKGAAPKTKRDKGKVLSVPKAHGNTAISGFARYFVDTLARVLPIDDESKSVNSRRTFWEQIDRAAEETNDPALRAVQAFGRRMQTDSELQARLRADVEALKPAPGDRCTFAWLPQGGATVIEQEPVRSWYRRFYESHVGERQQAGPQGLCQITRTVGPLARSHSTKIAGVPGGIASGVSLVSNDKAAFESYGLDGAVNASISHRAAEGYARALIELIGNRLFPGKITSLRVGETLFVFWTRQAEDLDDFMTLDRAEPEDVARLLESPVRGRESHAVEPDKFYCLCLSGNSARAIVRNYLEVPVADAHENLAQWFRDLSIVDDTVKGQGQVANAFPLWMLAAGTIREGDDVPPGLASMLMEAALKSSPVPGHVLVACLQRLRVESGPLRFRPARMGLIRLILNRTSQQGEKMSALLDAKIATRSPAYACGRLLALLARCQSPRSFGADAPLLERYYGSASTAPRSVFPVLLRMNRHHLQKIRDDNPGFAYNLEAELEERLAPFRNSQTEDGDFPALLSLTEQGQFALGFYHQRAEYRRQAAERKAAEV